MKKVFISYARDDSKAARDLLDNLPDAEVSGWMDLADINSGDAVSRSIKDAIRDASAVVVLLSPQSAANQWLNFEIGAALAMDKRIIPVLIGDGDIEVRLPDWLQGMMYIDARKRPMAQLAQEVARFVSAA